MIPDRLGKVTSCNLAWGTAGRDIDNPNNYYTLGDGSNSDSGPTTVHVQLFDGRDPTVDLNQTRAQGHYVLCQVDPGIVPLPPFGALVLVATPSSYSHHPGMSTILMVRDARAPNVNKAGDRYITAPVPGGAYVVTRTDGTVEVGALNPQQEAAVAAIVEAKIAKLAAALNSHVHTSAVSGSPTGPAYVSVAANTPVITDGGAATVPATLGGTSASNILKISG